MKIDTEALLLAALKKNEAHLEVLIASEKTRNIGIMRHEGVPYVWDLQWKQTGKVIDFLLEVFQVVAQTRKDGTPRADRRPKLKLAASRQFEQKVL